MKKSRIALYSVAVLLGIGVVGGVTSCTTEIPTERPAWNQEYKIKVEQVKGATLSVSKTKADKGDLVEVKVSDVDEENYTLKGLKAGDVTITSNSNGKFTFLMPGKDITVKAVLTERDRFSVTLPEETEEIRVEADTDTASLLPGTKVTLHVTNKAPEKVNITEVKAGEFVLGGLNGVYSFIMPSENIAVSVLTEPVIDPTERHNVILPSETDEYKVEANVTDDVAVGTLVKLTVTKKVGEEKYISKVSANDVVLGLTNSGTYDFVLPSGESDVVVKVEIAETDPLDLKHSVLLGEVPSTVSVVGLRQNVKAGETITLEVSTSDEAKYIKSVKAGEIEVAGVSGRFRFVMPAHDVVISVEEGLKEDLIEKHNVILPVTDESSLFTITADQAENVHVGSLVTLNITLKDATYDITSVTLNGRPLIAANEVTFNMPKEDAVIEVTLKQDENRVPTALSIDADAISDLDENFILEWRAEDGTTLISSALPGQKVRLYIRDTINRNDRVKVVDRIRIKRDNPNDNYDYDWYYRDDGHFKEDNWNSDNSEYEDYLEYTVDKYATTVNYVSTDDKAFEVRYTTSGKGNAYALEPTTKAKKGERVRVTPVATDGTKITGITVTNLNSYEEIPTTYTAAYTSYYSGTTPAYYSFIMEAANVRVTFTTDYVEKVIGASTDEHVELNNFRTNSIAGEGEGVVARNRKTPWATAAKYEDWVYFDVDLDEDYMIDTIKYVVDGDPDSYNNREIDRQSNGSYGFRVPEYSTSLEIVATTKSSVGKLEITDVPEGKIKLWDKVTQDDGTTTLVPFTRSNAEGDTLFTIRPASTTRIYFTFEPTTVEADSKYVFTGLKFNDRDVFYKTWLENGVNYFSLYDDDQKSLPEVNTVTYTVQKVTKKFNSATDGFVDRFYGTKLSASSYDRSYTTERLVIDEYGAYGTASTTSSYSLPKEPSPDASKILEKSSELVNGATELTEGSTTFLYLENGWMVKKASSLTSTYIYKKEAAISSILDDSGAQKYSSLKDFFGTSYKYAKDDNNSNCMVQRYGKTDDYKFAYIDIKNDIYETELSAEVPTDGFYTGDTLILKKGNEVFKKLSFTSSSYFKELVEDGTQGTYTSAATSQTNNGEIVLDGAGHLNLFGITWEYTSTDVNGDSNKKLLTVNQDYRRSYNANVRFELTIDVASKTYEANLGNFPIDQIGTSYKKYKATGVVGSDGKTYDLEFEFEWDDSRYFKSYEYVDGVRSETGETINNITNFAHRYELNNGKCMAYLIDSRKDSIVGGETFTRELINDNGKLKIIANGVIGPKDSYHSGYGEVTWTLNNVEFIEQ